MTQTSRRQGAQLHPHHLTKVNWGRIDFVKGQGKGRSLEKVAKKATYRAHYNRECQRLDHVTSKLIFLKISLCGSRLCYGGQGSFLLQLPKPLCRNFQSLQQCILYTGSKFLFSKTLPFLPRAYCLFFSAKPSFSSLSHMSAAQM